MSCAKSSWNRVEDSFTAWGTMRVGRMHEHTEWYVLTYNSQQSPLKFLLLACFVCLSPTQKNLHVTIVLELPTHSIDRTFAIICMQAYLSWHELPSLTVIVWVGVTRASGHLDSFWLMYVYQWKQLDWYLKPNRFISRENCATSPFLFSSLALLRFCIPKDILIVIDSVHLLLIWFIPSCRAVVWSWLKV